MNTAIASARDRMRVSNIKKYSSVSDSKSIYIELDACRSCVYLVLVRVHIDDDKSSCVYLAQLLFT